MRPKSEAEVSALVAQARAAGTPLAITGGGTAQGLGHPVSAGAALHMSDLSGITLYEPGALTLVAQTGTPLSQIEETLAAEGQRLAFEPMDHRVLLGSSGAPTIGGVVATNNSGSARFQAGACRDSLIGVRFVTGEGDVIKNGGRVMKNVTGLDLVKLMCGAFGTLGVLTEVAFKLLPAPAREASLIVPVSGVREASALMAKALGSPYEVSGAAALPYEGTPAVALRVFGMEAQVDYRLGKLKEALAKDCTALEGAAHRDIWRRAGNVADFRDAPIVWRIAAQPSAAPSLVEALEARLGARTMLNWGGGLIWAALPPGSGAGTAELRDISAKSGASAMLFKAPDAVRAAEPVFAPQHPRVARIGADLRARFDPGGILNPGRMAA